MPIQVDNSRCDMGHGNFKFFCFIRVEKGSRSTTELSVNEGLCFDEYINLDSADRIDPMS
jgi:hypothetical protein